MIRKAKINDSLYDVILYEDYCRGRQFYNQYFSSTAIDRGDGTIYPMRTITDIRPGFYSYAGPNGGVDIFKPPMGSEIALYSEDNVINFSQAKNLKEVIEAQDKLTKAERSILTTIDNLTVPEIRDNDTPAMRALKQAIIYKQIDLDKYDYRFGIENYPNDKRLLKRDSITLPKLKAYGDALDIAITLTLSDKSPDVPNPMNHTITVQINDNSEVGKDEEAE